MNCYKLSIDCYAAFLQASVIPASEIAAAYTEYNGFSIDESFDEAKGTGLVENGSLTDEGFGVAESICNPDRAVVASNSLFGLVPVCVFCLKNNVWTLVAIDYSSNEVNIVANIATTNIVEIAKDSLIGNPEIIDFSNFTITLNNDEMALLNCCQMLVSRKVRSNGGPLKPSELSFKIQDLVLGRDFATMAFADDVVLNNSEIFDFVKDSDRCRKAMDTLVAKGVFAKGFIEGYYQPGRVMIEKLAPQRGMFIVSYGDLSEGIGHKYYVFPNSILEVTADKNSVTFTSVRDLNYTLWTQQYSFTALKVYHPCTCVFESVKL